MTSKIISIYCKTNVVITMERPKSSDTDKTIVDKHTITIEDFEEIIQTPYATFLSELNSNVEAYSKEVLDKEKSLLSAELKPEGKKIRNYTNKLKKEYQTFITIQGKSIPVVLFEEIIDYSFADFLEVLKHINKKTYAFTDKVEELRKKNLDRLLNDGKFRLASRMTKKVYVHTGATDYMKTNYEDWFKMMYELENKIVDVIETFDDGLIKVSFQIGDRICTPVFHESTLTPITKA